MAFVPIYIIILGFTIIVDYFAGIYIEGAKDKSHAVGHQGGRADPALNIAPLIAPIAPLRASPCNQ